MYQISTKIIKNDQRSAKAPVAKTRKLIVDPPKKMTYRYILTDDNGCNL